MTVHFKYILKTIEAIMKLHMKKYLIIPCYVQFKLKYILLKYIIYMHMFKGMLLLKVLLFLKNQF